MSMVNRRILEAIAKSNYPDEVKGSVNLVWDFFSMLTLVR